jgi:hypothetical protein
MVRYVFLLCLVACGGRIAATSSDAGPDDPTDEPERPVVPVPTASTAPTPTTEPSSKPPGECPQAHVGVGARCTKEGLVCEYPDTCTPGQKDRMRCKNGEWTFADGDPYVASCPARPPRHGDRCLCRHIFAPCEYGSCDGQTVPTRASCNLKSQMWLVDVINCKDGGR